jgi:NAD(P)H-dependent flavin oxidoreductase YrpB (nitropropane dioxygenase family)
LNFIPGTLNLPMQEITMSVLSAVKNQTPVSSPIPTRFTQHYNIRHAFTQAGMAFAGWSPQLAAAVSMAGGIGAIGAGLLPEPVVRQLVSALQASNCGLYNFNFLTNFDHDAQVRACAEMGVPIVSFHWGHPSAGLIRVLKDAGCQIWEQVGTVEHARKALGNGVDVIIAQGHEAGGHNFQGLSDSPLGTFVLVPTMRDALGDDVLLLASGGIGDGRGVAASLALGADGVWVGTRLVASDEAASHPEHKRRVVAATGSDTVYSHIFGPDQPAFNPMRLLKNGVVKQWNNRLSEVPTDNSASAVIGKTMMGGQEMTLRKFSVLLPTPDTSGDWEEMPFLAGQGVGLVNDILPAAHIVERMMSEAAVLLGKGARLRA